MADQEPIWPPTRLRDLDKNTIEFLARLSEDEIDRLIEVSHLEARETKRLKQFLSLPQAQWEAGFSIVTRSVFISALMRKIPKFVLGLAAVLIAINQIWGWASPYLTRFAGK